MYPEFDVPVSYAGIISMIIALGTIVSSLQSDRLTRKLGAGKVTALSVAMTAFALFGFSISHSFFVLIFWAIPYGLGAGSVDAAGFRSDRELHHRCTAAALPAPFHPAHVYHARAVKPHCVRF